jgi:hypothetical protein
MKSKKNAAQQAGPHLKFTTVVKPLVVRKVSEVCCGASDLREKVTKRTFMVREELLERKDDVPQCTAASTSPAFR